MARGHEPRVIRVENPLTDTQLVGCAIAVVIKLVSGGSAMVRMVEHEDIKAMAMEAVVRADRCYQPERATRTTWVVEKAAFLVKDMMRLEARHTVCLSANEFRGVALDKDGNRVKSRIKLSLDKPVRNFYDVDDREDMPNLLPETETPAPWLSIYNRQLRERLELALDRLPDQRTAAAFRLIVWHEWTHKEVGDLFGLTAGRISQMLTKARPQLRAEFFDLAPDRRNE